MAEPRTRAHRGFTIERVGGEYRTMVRYLPRYVGAETSDGVVAAKRYREVCAELDRLIERGRLKEVKRAADGGAPPHVMRDERLATLRAKRGTDEWRENGEALRRQREEEMAFQIERRRKLRVNDWEWASFQVNERKLDIAMDEFEGMLMDAAMDLDIPFDETDTIAYDIMVAYLSSEVMTGKPTKAKVAMTIRLLTHLSFAVEDALDFLGRHWAVYVTVKP